MNLSLQVSAPRMDLYQFAAGPSANVLGFLRAAILGNVDNCLVNDNNGGTASSENGETVDIIIDDVNSDSNNIVSGQVSNSSVANHSTASMKR